jgi:aspartyl-tRNA(Asn)/glutamyl-tRNA(Gln) amidotransferase subunit C
LRIWPGSKVSEAGVPHLQGELNAILTFVEELASVDVGAVEDQ